MNSESPITCIIPIFFKVNEKFWLKSPGKKLLAKFIFNISLFGKQYNVKIFTNEDFVLELAKKDNIEAKYIDVVDRYSELLPYGAHESFNELQKKIKNKNHVVAILNFRNPFLDLKFLDAAYLSFKKSKCPILLSVKEVRDHPCQLTGYCRVFDFGVFHYLDYDFNSNLFSYIDCASSAVMTSPFYFDWESRNVFNDEGNRLFFQKYENYRIKYFPISAWRSNKSILPVLYFENKFKARLVFAADFFEKTYLKKMENENNKLVGCALDTTYQKLISCLFCTEKEGVYYIYFDPEFVAANSNNILRLTSFNTIKKQYETITESKIKNFYFDLNFDVNNLNYSIIDPLPDGGMDFQEEFPVDADLWNKNKSSNDLMCSKTGKTITGRHDFHEVFEPDGSIVMLANDMFYSLVSTVQKGKATGFILEADKSLIINSEFDLLRYNAIRKAKTDAKRN